MRLEAISIGARAAEILSEAASGTVIAVFERSFYIRLPEGIVCLGTPEIGQGPLNVPVGGAAFQWHGWATSALPAIVKNGSITIGNLEIRIDDANIWAPPPLPEWSVELVQAGIGRLRAALPLIAAGGLAEILTSPDCARHSNEPILRAAMPAVDTLMDWISLSKPIDPPASAICTLLGLGPGLTPSGDDFLGGVLVALRLAERTGAGERLGHIVEHLGRVRTNEISLAHLRAANRFGLTEKLHRVTRDILLGDVGVPHASLVPLSQVKHHSPWDTLAGLTSAFEALARRLEPTRLVLT